MSENAVETDQKVREALSRLDGSDEAAVSLVTGLSPEEIEDLGGTSTPPGQRHGEDA